MHHATLARLTCPSCRGRYRAICHTSQDQRIDYGYLTCTCRGAVIPILAGFAMFTEPLLHAGLADLGSLEALALELFGTAAAFRASVDEKRRRNVFESYAAFQPFNESFRAIEPLLTQVLGNIGGGDLVLDTWCRTGWSGEWLAGIAAVHRQRQIGLPL